SDDIVTYLVPDPVEQKSVVRLSMADYDRYDDVYKILVLDEPERLEGLRQGLPDSFNKRFATFKSWDRLLEFVHVDGSKGAALSRLAAILDIPRADIIAIGDEENDISMITTAGIGIAMGNAKPIVKAVAGHITLSNRYDGVAAAIDAFVFAKERENDDV
ncbi:MAG: HAD hydrolase family protein, partial [bacterium]